MKPVVIVMVGISGSGKSGMAMAEARFYHAMLVSSDQIRKELLGDEACQDDNPKVFDTLYDRVKRAVKSGQNVVIDATNITLKSRQRVFQTIKGISCDVKAIVMATDIETCVENDKNRERSVGRDVIIKQARSFQFPQTFEGFNQITVYTDDPVIFEHEEKESIKRIQSLMNEFDQQSRWHKYTLGQHSIELQKLCKLYSVEYNAAMFHDIGKLFTKEIDENGQAHYLGHDNFGTYFILTRYYKYLTKHFAMQMSKDPNYVNELLFYVNYHMLAHNIKTDKSVQKYSKIFGEERLNRLLEFAKNDRIASGVETPVFVNTEV